MYKNNVGKTTASGLVWTFGERICAQLVSTIVTIQLAKILDPTHYGIIAIVVVVISFCDVFVSSGFGKAVVQKNDAEEIDFNTAFVLSVFMGITLYLAVSACAPLIADFFNEPLLKPVLRVIGIRIPIAAINSIQHAYIQKRMQFRKFFFATLIGTVISGVFGLTLAYRGFGVWALVAQYLSNTVIDTVFLGIVCGWKIHIQFSKESARRIISFGGKLLVGNLVDTAEKELRTVLIGKVFGSGDLGYYDQGQKFPRLFVGNLTTAISKVMLPTFSELQSEEERMKYILRSSIHMGVFCIAPLMFGLIGCAHNLIIVLYTEKWLPSVPYICIFAFSYLTRPLETFCNQAILARGRSDIILFVSVVVNTISIIIVIVSTFIMKSVLYIALGVLFVSSISFLCYGVFAVRIVGYSVREQLHDIVPSVFSAIIMAGVVWAVGLLPLKNALCLVLQIAVGVLVYYLVTSLLKLQGNTMLKRLLKSKIGVFRRN